MRVLNYLEAASWFDRAGIGTAADQQRQALASVEDVDVVTTPWRVADPAVPAHEALADLQVGRVVTDYDVAHCNLIGPGSLAVARHAIANDRPLVLHVHVTSEDFRDSFRGSNVVAPVLRRYLKHFYSQADQVLCPSEYTKDVLADYPIDAPVRPVSNGVDLDSLAGHERFREEYRDRYDLEGMVPFAVGNVFERKGLTRFCELAEDTDYEFAWFGTYDTGPQASATVRKWTQDPPENVRFSGWVEEKRGMFAAGDVFLFPAKVENQGIVVLEAMACGKPCVISDIPVFREYFEDGHDCIMCSTHEEYREALDRLADDPALRERIGKNGRETAERHGLDRVGEELADVYRDLLADR